MTNGERPPSSEVDFGRTAVDYGTHRADIPAAFFDALEQRGWIARGRRALDLGTGTGTVARGLAARGLEVVGTDPSRPMIEQAAALSADLGEAVTYRVGCAEEIEAVNASFDLVTAGQCWHWFDGPRAAAEVARVLRPGGRVVVPHFDWLPLAGNVVEATEELIRAHNPQWHLGGGTGIWPAWLAHLSGAGFTGLETFSFDVDQSYTHAAWRGRIRASAGVAASLDADAVERFDRELEQLLAARFPADPLRVPHRVWAVSGVV